MSTTVSVVVPSFDRPEPLQRCLDALARHHGVGRPVEVVVVDDGSPDPVSLDPSRWARAFDLSIVRQDNAGPAAARNRGVDTARGEIVAFTDDDCLPAPDWLARLVAALESEPGALVGGSTWNGLTGDTRAQASQAIVDLVYEHFNADAADSRFLASNNLACRRADFERVGGFDEGFAVPGAEDRDLCDRWRSQIGPLSWIRDARVEHRHHQSLPQFLALHHRYGRGAWIYQSLRRERGTGRIGDDLGFHHGLPRRAMARLSALPPGQRLRVAGLLVAWQAANASGFLREGLAAKLGEGRRP